MRRTPSKYTAILIIAALASAVLQYFFWHAYPLYVAKESHDYPSQLKSIVDGNVTPLDAYGSKLKILLFITTHMSEQHIWFLKACWPAALKHSSLLRSSDIAVYLNPPREERMSAIELLQQTFPNQPLAVHVDDPASRQCDTLNWNCNRQAGAIAALSDAARAGWFSGYDWIIRVNPDVIIRNDTWMLETMRSEPNVTGLLINCRNSTTSFNIHTDFFAIKTEALPADAFTTTVNDREGTPNAEYSFTRDIMNTVLKKGNMRWIPGAQPPDPVCRAGWKRDPTTTDVIHYHPAKKLMKDLTCPIPF